MPARTATTARPKTIVSVEKIATNIFMNAEMRAEAAVVSAHRKAAPATRYMKLSPSLKAATAATSPNAPTAPLRNLMQITSIEAPWPVYRPAAL